MKKQYFVAVLSVLIIAAMGLQGCLKDTVERTYTYTLFRPVYKTTAEVRANIRSNAPEEVQHPGKLFIIGQYIFLNEVNKGVHIIDNANPVQPRNVAFIDIPGNVDIAVKGNTLYADLYTDLVAIDITNPLQSKVTKVVEDVFPHRYYNNYFFADSSKVIVDWVKKDTTVTEKYSVGGWAKLESGGLVFSAADRSGGALANFSGSAPVGISGSMARFTIINERLYTVGTADLKVFNISQQQQPAYVAERQVGQSIETIYPFKNRLFIGSTTGMFIYDVSNPDNPNKLGQFSHVRSCDPVIADDNYAYVTLRSGTACMGFTNQMEVLSIANLNQPALVKTYNMTNPHGLSKDDDLLFVCDGKAGLKIYNAAAPANMQLLKTIDNLETFDVIAYNGVAIVVAADGLYQYDYRDRNNIRLLSRLNIAL